MTDKEQSIFDYLLQRVIVDGEATVRTACRHFILRKTYAGSEKVRRKPIPKSWVNDAYAKQSGVCPRCNEHMEIYEAVGDHKQPIALGGQHNRYNIQAMHSKCNASKGANDFVKESKLSQTGQTKYVPIEEEV